MRNACQLASAIIIIAACGGSGGGGGGPTLSISPPSATIVAGSAPVTFTATLSGSSNAIAWSLTGPGSISATSGTSTAYTPPTSVASATSATLTASAGSALTASATITLNPPAPITVAGQVLDSARQPRANVAVVIGSKSTVTDANGNFTLSNVTPPYNLITVLSTPSKVGMVYQGLTRADPKILYLGTALTPPNAGTVSGTISGGDALPAPATDRTHVAWGSPETRKDLLVSANPYTLNLSWFGPTSTTGTLHALQWVVDASGLPTSYRGHGTKSGVAVASSGNTLNANVAMSAVSSQNIAGSVSLPASYTLGSKTLAVSFADNATISLASDSSSTTGFNYVVPSGIGGTLSVTALGGQTGVALTIGQLSGIAPGATGANITLPTAAVPILPANAGTGINTSTDFTWTAFSGGIHLVNIQPANATDPAYFVVTSATTGRIPDLSGQGLGLPSGASYSWTVVAIAPYASLDELAGSGNLLPAGNPVYESVSATRTFTTQ